MKTFCKCGCGQVTSGRYKKHSKEYEAKKEDWLRLCRKCHMAFDFINLGIKRRFSYEHTDFWRSRIYRV